MAQRGLIAQNELKRDNAVAAERYASQAQLTAELAVAKSQSAQARKAADDKSERRSKKDNRGSGAQPVSGLYLGAGLGSGPRDGLMTRRVVASAPWGSCRISGC